MTKSQQSKSEVENKILLPHEESITADLLMRSQNLTQKIMDEVSKRNDEEFGEIEGVDRWGVSSNIGHARKKIKASEIFVDNTETYRHRKKDYLVKRYTEQEDRSILFIKEPCRQWSYRRIRSRVL